MTRIRQRRWSWWWRGPLIVVLVLWGGWLSYTAYKTHQVVTWLSEPAVRLADGQVMSRADCLDAFIRAAVPKEPQ